MVAESKGLTPLTSKPATGHDPKLAPSTFHPQQLSPQAPFSFLSSHSSSVFQANVSQEVLVSKFCVHSSFITELPGNLNNSTMQ